MKLGIMQPYFYPYMGYWQLMNAVDRFVILDDVNYITRGWVNRNRILINGEPVYITIPIQHASQNSRICDLSIHQKSPWCVKMLRSIELAYKSAPFFAAIYPRLKAAIELPVNNLAGYLLEQVRAVAEILGIETEIVPSSRVYENAHLSGEARIIDIANQELAERYFNLEGGRSIYHPESFSKISIELSFLKFMPMPYRQRYKGFASHLSIIDVLMEVGPERASEKLNEYELI